MTPEQRARAFADRIAEELRKEIVLGNNDEVERRRAAERELDRIIKQFDARALSSVESAIARESYTEAFPEPDLKVLVSQLRQLTGNSHRVRLIFFGEKNPMFACEVALALYGTYVCGGSSDESMEDAVQRCIDRWKLKGVATKSIQANIEL